MAIWQHDPAMTASTIQVALEAEHGVRISIGHLNALRRQAGLSRGKKVTTGQAGTL
jgi:transposase